MKTLLASTYNIGFYYRIKRVQGTKNNIKSTTVNSIFGQFVILKHQGRHVLRL